MKGWIAKQDGVVLLEGEQFHIMTCEAKQDSTILGKKMNKFTEDEVFKEIFKQAENFKKNR